MCNTCSSVAGEEVDSPRDVLLDLSASQKSSGFEFDEDDDQPIRGASQVQCARTKHGGCH